MEKALVVTVYNVTTADYHAATAAFTTLAVTDDRTTDTKVDDALL